MGKVKQLKDVGLFLHTHPRLAIVLYNGNLMLEIFIDDYSNWRRDSRVFGPSREDE
jgi:hypothetical protein